MEPTYPDNYIAFAEVYTLLSVFYSINEGIFPSGIHKNLSCLSCDNVQILVRGRVAHRSKDGQRSERGKEIDIQY